MSMENTTETPQSETEQVIIGDEEASKNDPESRPSLVINIQSWATPIIGLLMLAAGFAGGYFGRPLITNQDSPIAIATSQPQSSTIQQPQVPPTANPTEAATRQEMMDFLVTQTRHFMGDEEALVTIIEFSDFQ